MSADDRLLEAAVATEGPDASVANVSRPSDAMPIRRERVTLALLVTAVMLLLTGCQATPPDRHDDIDRLGAQLGSLPGVSAVNTRTSYSPAQGLINFTITAELADGISSDQVAEVTSRYLRDLRTAALTGYRAELDLTHGWDLFAVDSGWLPIANDRQIVDQSRDWIALRGEFPHATVRFRATIKHPGGQLAPQEAGRSNRATITMADTADYRDVATVLTALCSRFSALAGMDWDVSAGKLHSAQIRTSARYPTPAELGVWDALNSDQAIPHVDRLTINGPVSPPIWFAEKTIHSHDVAVALDLARKHLPAVATLPGPVLYTASDQISGHIGGAGNARGPVAITVGGCTKYDPLVYLPSPAELTLLDAYESCHR
ncbi:hypothetical protein [Mycolicibacterium sphagni]|uniref:Uncharacterized protein n=1 Tax=Mycolicibacterium sphagni TaxID=1786 RepID=A0A255DAW1_9MYCO|nr:hypothetical protein [Mycolicibacterium sphagni]MCV7178107.1 hypothetical protein [Mycolicibacterium sphagni]OYN76558.1 hypothetical protein CG716_21985 [Mycolicibacterium sphagni]